MQNERYRHVARPIAQIKQEIGVEMNLAVIFNVEARTGFEVGEMVRVWQLHIKTSDPGTNLRCRRDQVDPDWL